MGVRRGLASVLAFLLWCGLMVAVAGPVSAACDTAANPVLCENALPGNPASEWDNIGGGAGDTSIQGFATDISVNKGQTIGFKVNTPATSWRIDFYRLGYYGGSGARKQGTVSIAGAQNQPNCLTDSTTGLVDCGNWGQSASWTVPATSTSGIYIARLVRNDTGGASHMIFVVRDDAGTAKILFQASDTTWQAYNEYGGNSLYVGNPAGRAYKVSYNRPFTTRATGPEDWVFNAEYPMIRWLESNGYDVSYTTDTDSDRRGNLIQQHQTFLSVGHDEYWSGNQRTNVEAARSAGVNLAFFSGNEVFWKTRFENSISSPSTANRTLVTYKETHADAKIDPTPAWTGTWRDPRFSPPADGGRPENALTGQLFVVNDGATTAIQVPAAEGKLRLWRNTTVATLGAGKVATFPNGTLGYEWDVDRDNGARPAGLVHLSSTTASVPSLLVDYGSSYGTGTATHTLTLYRAPSGALVFGAGTVQWSWGLDANHDRGSAAADVRMQQATVNLLADMGAQAGSLRPGLVGATASTDHTGPTVTITAPAAGATVTAGSTVAITGTASDVGGQVGAVEVSTDGGVSWHPATGRAAWTYSWSPNSSGPVTIMVRAADDSANLGAAVSRALNSGGGGPQVCPCTIWPSSAVPSVVTDSDAGSVELGVKFRASVAGTVTGVRFYKGPSNTGTHVGRLWSSTGTQLATVTFTGETASGWQQATFGTPVAVTAGVTYVVSYVAPVGRYSADSGYFTGQGVANPPLSALGSGVDGLDGVYHYGTGFPTDSYQDTNYWVDVVFSTTTTTTTSTTTTTTTSSTTTTTTSPTTTTTTTAPPPACPCSIWRNNPTPGTPSDGDTGAVELGLKFRATRNGTVTGVRFYKGAGNTGTHVGNLWSSTGTNLGHVNFTNETASGWQTATFSSPVSVTAGTTYVVSYFAPVGRYAGDANFFTTTGVSSPPLQALANGTDGANGVYRYGTASGFPSSTYQSTNYWVDVIFN